MRKLRSTSRRKAQPCSRRRCDGAGPHFLRLEGRSAKYAKMIRNQIEAFVAVKHDRTGVCFQIAADKDVVNPLVDGPTSINVWIMACVGEARFVGVALGKNVMKCLVAVQHCLHSLRLGYIVEVSTKYFGASLR